MGKEANILTGKLRVALAGTACLFTNVRGKFRTMDGSRIVAAGLLMEGASDQIGFTPIKITPEMVGRTMAVFTALEVKAGKDTMKREQWDFLHTVRNYGGIAGVVRQPLDGEKIINEYIDKRHVVPVLSGTYSDGESNDNS